MKHPYDIAAVYEKRFEAVIESTNEIENCLYEVECLFDEKTVSMIKDIYKFRKKLFITILSLIEHYRPNWPKRNSENDRVIYSDYQNLDKDIFYQDLQTEIRKINDYFKPYLKLDR